MSLWAIIRNISAWARNPCLSRGKTHLDWCSSLICRWGPSSFSLVTDYFSSSPPGEDFTQTQPVSCPLSPISPHPISFTRAILYLVCRPGPMWENATFSSPASAGGAHLPTLLAHEGPAWRDIFTWQQTGSEKISSACIPKIEATFVLGVFFSVFFLFNKCVGDFLRPFSCRFFCCRCLYPGWCHSSIVFHFVCLE